MHLIIYIIEIYILLDLNFINGSLCSKRLEILILSSTQASTKTKLLPPPPQPPSPTPIPPSDINSSNTMSVPVRALPNWNQVFSHTPINNPCNVDLSVCNETFNPFTSNTCRNLMYFNIPVCGGLLCFYNQHIGKCDGQCENTFLETWVSQVEVPSKDSDCVCGSSKAFRSGDTPTCDITNCFGNSCAFAFVSINRKKDNTLYGFCKNDKRNL